MEPLSAVEMEPLPTVEAVRAVTRLSRRLERAAGDLGLPHYRVLAAVASGDARASRVAARLALGKPTVSAAVESLCARGLLARGGDADDQRAVHLSLTDDGRRVLADAEAAMCAALEAVAARLDDPADAVEAVAALGRALDEEVTACGQRTDTPPAGSPPTATPAAATTGAALPTESLGTVTTGAARTAGPAPAGRRA